MLFKTTDSPLNRSVLKENSVEYELSKDKAKLEKWIKVKESGEL